MKKKHFLTLALVMLSAIVVAGVNNVTGNIRKVAPANATMWTADMGFCYSNEVLEICNVYGYSTGSYNYGYTASNGESFTFNDYMQVRVASAPSSDYEYGEEYGDCSPITIYAYQNAALTAYYRRQLVNNTAASNDNKDLKLVDITDGINAADMESVTFGYQEENESYAFADKTYELKADHRYVLYATGTTLRLYGLRWYAGEADTEYVDRETITFNRNYSQYYYGNDTIFGAKTNVLLSPYNSGSNPYNYYGTLRFYNGNKIEFFSEETIANITFMTNGYSMNLTPSEGEMEGNVWTGSANEVSFVNESGSQTRFSSITITYEEQSVEKLFARLQTQIAATNAALEALAYPNVMGNVELKALVATAAAVTLDDEAVDAVFLRDLIQQLRNATAALVRLDSRYAELATAITTMTAAADGNDYVDVTALAEATALQDAITQAMSEGAYSAAEVDKKLAEVAYYTAHLGYTHLDIYVAVPGSMGDSILAKVENFSDVQSLRLTGKLNDTDIYHLKYNLSSVIDLDLAGLNWTNIPDEQFYEKTNLQHVVLPNNLEWIGSRAFYNCQSLQSIVFPATLRSIYNYAFYQTYNIGDVVLPEGLTKLESDAFYSSRLTSITFPSTLKTISSYCFYDCDYLKQINFNGQTSIAQYAFYSCNALESVTFPETLTAIENYAFRYCTNLKNIQLNEGLTSIGNYAFNSCSSLKSVTIPSSVQTFNGYYAFRSCDNLQSVTCLSIVPPYCNNYRITDQQGLDLYVPQLSVNVYKQTAGWSDFNIKGINVMPDNIVINSDYKLNWPDSLSIDYKPNVTILERGNNDYSAYGSLTVTGNSTLSAGLFNMKYDPNKTYDYGYNWDSERQEYYYNRFSYASLVNEANVRADNVRIELWLRANRWEFLTFPYDIKVSDIVLAQDIPFVIRKYDGEKRAAGLTGQTWVDMTADSTLHAGQGYIWRSPNISRDYNGFYLDALQTVNKNNIFASGDVEVPLNYYESEFAHNRSWNLIGNPYPCFFDIRAMETSAPITVWNAYYNNYRAYSPADDAYILNPGQAFFVQRPVDEEYIVFHKQGRQTNLTVRDADEVTYNNNGSRARVQRSPRSVFNIIVSSGEQGDRTRFVINADASTAYDAGRDASKFMSIEKPAVQLYTIENGVSYAINERPFANGTVALGMTIATEGLYTITLDTQVENEVFLVDNLTGQEIRLDGNSEGYTFHSTAGTFDSRFTIRLGNGSVTGIGEISTLNSQPSTVYDLQGRRVSEPQKGIYVKGGKKTVVK